MIKLELTEKEALSILACTRALMCSDGIYDTGVYRYNTRTGEKDLYISYDEACTRLMFVRDKIEEALNGED